MMSLASLPLAVPRFHMMGGAPVVQYPDDVISAPPTGCAQVSHDGRGPRER